MKYWIWRYWHENTIMHSHVLRRLRCCPRGDKSNFGPSSFGLNFQWKSTIVLRVQISHLFGSIWFFFSYFARRFSTWLTQTCTLIYTKSLGGWVGKGKLGSLTELIIHVKKLLDSDWLRAVQFKCNNSAKSVTTYRCRKCNTSANYTS